MAYKMPSPKPEGKYILYTIYSPSANVLTSIASVCRLWASVLDFQRFDEAI